jgi:hypothetical protein
MPLAGPGPGQPEAADSDGGPGFKFGTVTSESHSESLAGFQVVYPMIMIAP